MPVNLDMDSLGHLKTKLFIICFPLRVGAGPGVQQRLQLTCGRTGIRLQAARTYGTAALHGEGWGGEVKLGILATGLSLVLMAGCGQEDRVAFLLKRGDDAREKERYDEAIRDYSKALRLDPESPTAYLHRGSLYVVMGELDNGLADLNKAIDLDPQRALAFEMLGYAYFGKQRPGEAITNYDAALKLEPDNERVIKARGKAYYWKGDFTNAIADLTRALQFVQNDAEIYRDRGGAFFGARMINEALNDFNDAIRLDPEDNVALYVRAQIYSKVGSYTNAVRDLDKVVGVKPKAAGAQNLLAWLLATCPDDSVRDGKRAVALATRACELSKWKNYTYVDTLAAAYAETGDFEQAVKYQTQAAGMGSIPEENRTNVNNRIELYRQHEAYRLSGKSYD